MNDGRKSFENELIDYLFKNYYSADIKRLSNITGYTKQQLNQWITGARKPRLATMRYILSKTIAPEFTVVCELEPMLFSSKADIRPELQRVLGEHQKKSGIYAFYDSACGLFYIGKASTSLIGEMAQRLGNNVGLKFPKLVKQHPKEKWQVVRYVSAYEIPDVEHIDYQKHVEALLLRISKPIDNIQIGSLGYSKPPRES
jgi:hypothetical protein